MDFEKLFNIKNIFDTVSDNIFNYAKRKKSTLIIPAYNEEKMIKHTIRAAKQSRFVDEIIVVDDCSKDNTYNIASKEGIKVIRHEVNKGKGKAIRTGIEQATHEIICFIDADIPEWNGGLISKIIKPVALGEVDFVKTSFNRSMGRVTLLTAKPLLKLLFPTITLEQPLSGQFCTTKEFLSKIKIESRYGIDIGIVIDAQRKGLKMQEVFLGTITNKSKPLQDLTPMAEQVAETIAKKAKIIPAKYHLIIFCLEKSAEDKQKYLKETINNLLQRNHEVIILSSKTTEEITKFFDFTQAKVMFLREKNKKIQFEKIFSLLCEIYKIKPKNVMLIAEGNYCKRKAKEVGLLIVTKNTPKEMKNINKVKIDSWTELLVLAK